jgi:hypothetical protein
VRKSEGISDLFILKNYYRSVFTLIYFSTSSISMMYANDFALVDSVNSELTYNLQL